MGGKICRESFRKPDGGFCAVQVEAATLYEAVVIALSSLSVDEMHQSFECNTRMKVQVLEPGPSHVVPVADVQRWLDRPSFDASELAAKRQLRRLLAS